MSIKNKLFEDIITVTGGIVTTFIKANKKIVDNLKTKIESHDDNNVSRKEYENLLELVMDLKQKQEVLSNKLDQLLQINHKN